MRLKLIIGALAVTAVAATPAIAAKPKSLFEALFPKLIEKRVKREQAAKLRANASKPQKVAAPRNYTYAVAKSGAVILTPPVFTNSVASTDDNAVEVIKTQAVDVHLELSSFQQDLVLAGEITHKAAHHLAKAITAHYESNPEYLWVNDAGELNARARSVLKVFAAAAEYGLRSEDYMPASAHSNDETAGNHPVGKRLMQEVEFSTMVLRYAMDARFGVVNPNKLSGYHDFPEKHGHASEIWTEIVGGALPANTLAGMHPANEKFLMLKEELAGLSAQDDDTIDLPTDILIKPGNTHDELPMVVAAIAKRSSDELIKEFSETFQAYSGDKEYNPELVKLVKAYQKEAGLGPDGVVGRKTASKLAGIGPEKKVQRVKLAMERLRWLPRKFGERHVFINQPEFRARYIEDGNETLSMRAIVGKRSNQTSFFYDEIEHVIYNPYWGVPRSIIVNEMLPQLRANPSYLDAKGYEVTNSRGQRVASASVDWTTVGSHPPFGVRQPPGARNALGEVKIIFPNKHAIYMHDTPSRHLFKKDQRALSHGCVRLHDPKGMAAAVLGTTKKHVAANISTGKNRKEQLSVKVPVYVSYFTAWPQADGRIGYFADIYGRDTNLLKAMDITAKARRG